MICDLNGDWGLEIGNGERDWGLMMEIRIGIWDLRLGLEPGFGFWVRIGV